MTEFPLNTVSVYIGLLLRFRLIFDVLFLDILWCLLFRCLGFCLFLSLLLLALGLLWYFYLWIFRLLLWNNMLNVLWIIFPNHKLFLFRSLCSEKLDHHELFHWFLKSYLLFDFLPVLSNEIISHQVYHGTHVIKVHISKIVVKFVKRQRAFKYFFTALGRPVCDLDQLAFLLCDSHALSEKLDGRLQVSTRD